MKTIWLLPIEPFAERYTEQWFRWFPKELLDAGFAVKTVQGKGNIGLDEGEFLSPVNTWKWKGTQVARMAELWDKVQDGDIIFSLDGWGSATTAVAYMRDATEKDVKLATYFHAGSYDIADFLARKGMRKWALDVERGWILASDIVFVATEFHKEMIQDELTVFTDNIHVVGQTIHAKELQKIAKMVPWAERKKLVVFPHRFAPEKAPHEFTKIEQMYKQKHNDEVTFLRTKDHTLNRDAYYRVLARAKVVVSTAYQETFGIAMQEGIALGAWAVAPHRLSYPEVLLGGGETYRNLDEAVKLIHKYLNKKVGSEWNGYHELAIGRMANILRNC